MSIDNSKPSLQLVLPAFNEALSLPQLIQNAISAAQEFHFTAEEFNLIIVNNGSTDSTLSTLQELKDSKLGPWFTFINLKENKGYGGGIFEGLKQSEATFLAWSHADEQCDPRDVFRGYLELIKSPKNQIVKGQRKEREFKDKSVTWVFEKMAHKLLNIKSLEINAQPKVFERSFLSLLQSPPSNFAFDLYCLYQAEKAGYTIQSIDVVFPHRTQGVSKWATGFLSRYQTIIKMIQYMSQLRNEEGPLR